MPSKMVEKFRNLLELKRNSGADEMEETPRRIQYQMPDPLNYDFYDLDPLTKRKMTICNLFVNHQKTVPEIASLLEASRKLVIDTLIEEKLLRDRRHSPRSHTP